MTKKVGSVATPPVVDTPKVAESAPEVVANEPEEAEFSSSMEAETTYVAPEGAQLPESEITPTTPIEDTAGVAEEASENEPEVGEVVEPDTTLGEGTATTADTTTTVADENSMTWLYDKLTPKPKERTPEEQAKFERQRRASAIILSIADAINGISNLGATVAGAPSKEIQSITGKWNEVLEASEKERQGKLDTWYANRHKAVMEDFRYNRDLAQKKADKEADNAEYDRRQAVEHANKMESMSKQFENQKEMAKIEGQMRAEAAKAKADADAKLAKDEHNYKMQQIAASKGGSDKGGDNSHKKYFVTSVNDTPVDVYLRNDEDFNKLFDIVKAASTSSEEGKKEYTNFPWSLDSTKENPTFNDKRDFVRANFAKYYDKIKNDPLFIHLSTQFRDNKGNVLEFKEEKTAYDPSKDPIVKGAAETQKILAEKEGPLMSSGILSNYGFELVDSPWYNKK